MEKKKFNKTKAVKIAKTGAIIAGAAAVGVAAGMLLSPKSGKENRKYLAKKGNEALKTTKIAAKKAYGKVTKTEKLIESKVKKVIKPIRLKKKTKKK